MTSTPSYLKSIKKESVVQSVINLLTDAIKNKELKPGDKIPSEPELAESLGVARSSVREAIKILTYLGVLESKRSEGTFVRDGYSESMIDPMVYGIILHQDSFDNLMELRQMTEVGMMYLAILHHTDEELRDLEDIVDEMKVAASSKDNPVDAFFEVDNRFHDKVAEMGKNPMADKVNRVVRTLTEAVRRETVEKMITSGRKDDIIQAHQDLLDAIRTGDNSDMNEKVRVTYFEDDLFKKKRS